MAFEFSRNLVLVEISEVLIQEKQDSWSIVVRKDYKSFVSEIGIANPDQLIKRLEAGKQAYQ